MITDLIKRNWAKDMLNLGAILHLFIGATLIGTGLIVALVSGFDSPKFLIFAASLGLLISFPVTYYVTKAILSDGS